MKLDRISSAANKAHARLLYRSKSKAKMVSGVVVIASLQAWWASIFHIHTHGLQEFVRREELLMSGITRRQALAAGAVSGAAMLAVSSPLSGQEKEEDAERVKAEFAALQGTWRCLRWEQEGVLMPEEARRTVSVVIKGESYKSTVDGVGFKEGKLTLDPSMTPNQADAPFDGGVNRSIYVRSGDYMILCVGGERRPSEFVCGGEKGGDSLYVFKIER